MVGKISFLWLISFLNLLLSLCCSPGFLLLRLLDLTLPPPAVVVLRPLRRHPVYALVIVLLGPSPRRGGTCWVGVGVAGKICTGVVGVGGRAREGVCEKDPWVGGTARRA